ncbi:zinc finger MYM-type protein 1-like [Diachasma alloeum]|uniref:zinc finger MYM-type protein 1-like n=1 Tax=Diachasma alloeum TaxID=454923 RepID=UPI000738466D|nr:zinc finger MYM-type protein 1-like [Diachasma alloeum]
MNTLDNFLMGKKRKRDEESGVLKPPDGPVPNERIGVSITSTVGGDTKVTTWRKTYPWIAVNDSQGIVCNICTEAVSKQLPVSSDPNKHLSSGRAKEMTSNRIALKKMVHTIQVLAKQGLPLRGTDDDQRSNFLQILSARSEDVKELKDWLRRDAHKWLHHDSQNEILDLMYKKILTKNLDIIKASPLFALMINETSDVSRLEQISVTVRVVSNELSPREIFLGFYNTSSTKSVTLFSIINDIFQRYQLEFKKLRGQCYDRAPNMAGKITCLRTPICQVEKRALFVHCDAHQLNLVVQDALEAMLEVKNFIGIVKELINFIHNSPKRIAEYCELQLLSLDESEKIQALTAFCPTRFILLTVPNSTCTNERSFSTLKYLKNYMRSTMHVVLQRLNSLATLYIHHEQTNKLDLDSIVNEFAAKNRNRTATFGK